MVAQGTPQQVMANPGSSPGSICPVSSDHPGAAASTRKRRGILPSSARARQSEGRYGEIPLGMMTCVTGVSGAGKSTLVIEISGHSLSPAALQSSRRAWRAESRAGRDRQSHQYRSIAHRPHAALKSGDLHGRVRHIRDLFAQLPESRVRGYKPGRFSFNVKGGRCEACQGDGLIRSRCTFCPTSMCTCDVCKGTRFNRETLEIHYKGKTSPMCWI